MEKKRYKLRTTAVLVLGALAFGAAAITVEAYEPCQRFVQKYVERISPARHYSKATLTRWAIWAKEHPNYHPPKRHPALQPKETLEKINFDCEVAPVPVLVAGLLTPPEFADLIPPPALVTIATVPPPNAPVVSLVNAPLDVPPTDTGDVPEPQTWLYLLTGMGFVWVCARRRQPVHGFNLPAAA